VQTGSPDAALAVLTSSCDIELTRGSDALTPQDLFRIGSVTKTYTGTVILELEQDGKLSLDDLATQWVPGLPNASSLTIRHLLTHQSGLYNYTEDATFLSKMGQKWTPSELVQIAIDHGAQFAPGTQWSYSNTDFIVLGMIAEQVGGAPLEQQIHDRLLAPLSLSHTFLDGKDAYSDPLAPGFYADGSDATYAVDPSAAWAAGSMVATVGDTAHWIRALASGDVLEPATQTEMLTPIATTIPGLEQGLTVLLLDAAITGGAGQGIGHDGHINGYDTQAFHFPATGTTIVSVVNAEGASANDVTAAVLGVLF
jgi:D-alanyl-D-alanine carboxypeptidase